MTSSYQFGRHIKLILETNPHAFTENNVEENLRQVAVQGGEQFASLVADYVISNTISLETP